MTPTKKIAPEKPVVSLYFNYNYIKENISEFSFFQYKYIEDDLKQLNEYDIDRKYSALDNLGAKDQMDITVLSSDISNIFPNERFDKIKKKYQDKIKSEKRLLGFGSKTDRLELLEDFFKEVQNLHTIMEYSNREVNAHIKGLTKNDLELNNIYHLLELMITQLEVYNIGADKISTSDIAKRFISISTSCSVSKQLLSSLESIRNTISYELELIQQFNTTLYPSLKSLLMDRKKFDNTIVEFFNA